MPHSKGSESELAFRRREGQELIARPLWTSGSRTRPPFFILGGSALPSFDVLHEVGLENLRKRTGPLTSRPGCLTPTSRSTATLRKRNAHSLTGPAGSGLMVDTNRCLHHGARSRGKDRLIVIAQYVRADQFAGLEDEYNLAKAAPPQDDPLDERALRRGL